MKNKSKLKLDFAEKVMETSSLKDLHKELENYIDIKKQSFKVK